MTEREPVKGSRMRITPLDKDGQPVGFPFEVQGTIQPEFLQFPETEGWVQDPVFPDTYTMEVSIDQMDPDLLDLLVGSHVHYWTVWVKPPWWMFWRGPSLACRCGKTLRQEHDDTMRRLAR